MSPADELRTLEEKRHSTGLTVEEEERRATLAEETASAAPGALPDPLDDAALFGGDPAPGDSSWMGTPDATDASDPFAESSATPYWAEGSLPAGESAPALVEALRRDTMADWDLGDADASAWISWCESQGLDAYDPDVIAWANWHYQQQSQQAPAQPEEPGVEQAADAAVDPGIRTRQQWGVSGSEDPLAPGHEAAPASEEGAFDQPPPHDWSAEVPELDALQPEGPGSLGMPASDTTAMLARSEEDELMAADGEPAFDLSSFDAESAASADDFNISADDDGPILEVGVDVFEVGDDELAPPEWIPKKGQDPFAPIVSSPMKTSPIESSATESSPTASSPLPPSAGPAGSTPLDARLPEPSSAVPETAGAIEPATSETLQVYDAAAFGMVALDLPEPDVSFDLEQAAASLAELEASLDEDTSSIYLDEGVPAEAQQGSQAAYDSPIGEASQSNEVASAPTDPEPSGDEPTSSSTEPQPLAPAGAPPWVAGTHRVVVHTVDGEVKRGTVTDIALEGPEVAFELQDGGSQRLPIGRIRAIFFMLGAGEPPPAPEGQQVRVTFRDGREVAGWSPDHDAGRSGFFVIPADERSHTARIWVYRAAARHVTVT